MCMGLLVEVRGQLPGTGSVLLPPGFSGLNADYQARWQLPLREEAEALEMKGGLEAVCATEMEPLGTARLRASGGSQNKCPCVAQSGFENGT